MIAVWESDISATFLIFRLKCSTDAAFLSFWASYSTTWPRCKRSFVSNNWCLVWTGSAFPQSFLSCKQTDAQRKDFVDIPEKGHSWFYTSLRLFVSFVEEIASPSWRRVCLVWRRTRDASNQSTKSDQKAISADKLACVAGVWLGREREF